MVMEHPQGRSFVREAWARVDMTKEFPLHDHIVFTDHSDGTITVSVPWSEFKVTTEGDMRDAKRAFMRGFKEFFRNNAEEQAKLGPYMEAHGYLPLSKRN